MTSKLTRAQLHERARENVKALKMASRQTAFESAREEILADLQLAELALAAMDSEPVAWTWHYREQWHVTNDKCRAEFVAKDGDVAVLPLYRHAQPVPVVEREPIAWLNDAYLARGVIDGEAGSEDAGPGYIPVYREAGPQPAPVVPDSYVMVPMRLTAENGAKGALSGEFSETKFVNCPECFGDDECETCDGSGRIEITVPVTWTTIKEIWAKGVEHFAAAPQSPGSEPATVPGKWIPVSEHLPKEKGVYQVWNGKYVDNVPFWFGSFQSLHSELITHWMPLPAAPQEVNHG